MAKTSIIEREKKREKVVAKFAVKRAELKKVVGDRHASDDERWQAQLQTAEASAQRVARAPAPTLCRNRSPARRLPQVRLGPKQIARSRDARRCARLGEGELVRAIALQGETL